MASGKTFGCCVSIIALAVSVPVHAEVRQFNIPAGELKAALKSYIEQSHLQLVFRDEDVRGKLSRRVSGTIDTQAALDQLLIGTGLMPMRGPRGATILTKAYGQHAALDPAPGSQSSLPVASSPNDIIVTAQKRRETIQDVPIAISAFTQETLDKQKIEGGPDLLKAVPNLTFSKSNFAGYNLEIRGIGTKALSVTTDPGVAVNFNSSTLITNRFFEQEFFDLERIEVLRGPQGTLYGRNATGGVVNIISAKPDLAKFGGYIKGEVGNFSSRRAQGAINIPILPDLLGVRLAGAYTNRDGFTTNDITMHRIDGRDLYTTRVTASLKPSSRLRSDLVWERFSENDSRARTAKQLCHRDPGPADFGSVKNLSAAASGQLSQGCKPGSLYNDAAYGVPNGLSLPYVIVGSGFLGNIPGGKTLIQDGVDPYASTTQTHDLRRISSISDPIYRAKSNVFEWNTTWDVAPDWALTAQSAYNRDRYYSTQDYNRFNTVPLFNSTDGAEGTGANLVRGGYYNDPQLGPSNRLVAQDLVTARSKQFSQEIRLSTNGPSPFQGTVGANYTYYKNQTDYYVFINALSAVAQGTSLIGNNNSDPNLCSRFYYDPVTQTGSYPTYPTHTPQAEANGCVYLDPNPLSKINGQGHNYFRSSNRFKLNSYGVFGDGTFAINPHLKLIGGLRYSIDTKVTTPVPSQLLLARGALAGTVNYGYPVDPNIKQRFRALTGRSGIQWSPQLDFTNDTMIYFTYSRGYKGGGTNPPPIGFDKTGNPPTAQTLSFPQTFKPEYVNSLEIGTKNTLLSNTVTLNLTGYYYDFSNYQVSQIVDRQAINENFDTRMYGFEGELVYKPNRALAVNANVGLQGSRLGRHQYSLDVMDRLQGHGDEYALVKAFVQLPSNCVVNKSVVEQQLLSNRAGAPNGDNAYDIIGLFTICPGSGFSQQISPDAFPNGGRGFYADVGGNQVPNAPHFTFNIGAEYNIPFAGAWVLTPRVDFYHQSGSYARVYNTSIDRLRGWENTNVSLRVGNPELGLLIEAYVKNVFDDSPITDAFINSDDTGLTTNVFTFDPRLIGVNITKKF